MPRFVKLASLDDLTPGAAQEVEFEGRIYAIYNIEGTISAIDGICPHQGGPLADGEVNGTIGLLPLAWLAIRHPDRQDPAWAEDQAGRV